jgi:hypothetical protein
VSIPAGFVSRWIRQRTKSHGIAGVPFLSSSDAITAGHDKTNNSFPRR